jgi:hypothetical protein
MTKRTIMEMARQVGYPIQHEEWRKATEEFVALVREDERNRTWTQQHWTDYERSIAAAEREECAKACAAVPRTGAYFAKLIRARGQS